MIRCIRFQPYGKNNLKGFVDLKFTKVGIIIHDCMWIEENGQESVEFAVRLYQDKNGNKHTKALIEFTADAQEARRQFQAKALEAIRAYVNASRSASEAHAP
jgi:hypothetical protein